MNHGAKHDVDLSTKKIGNGRTVAGFHSRPPAELAHTDAGRMLDVALSTIAVSRMGTLIAPANPMIVSTNASMMAPPCCKRSVLTA
jgi:hypothetical protein